MSIDAKQEHVRNHRLCFNCLSFEHRTRECARCRKCNRLHHTILHRDGAPSTHADNPNTLPVAEQPPQMSTVHSASATSNVKPTLQMTSVVILESPEGQQLQARALLDPGASLTLITNRAAQLLQLRMRPEKLTISSSSHSTNVTLKVL